MLLHSNDHEGKAARACGLSREALRQLRTLVEQRQQAAWTIGAALVSVYGPPGRIGVTDGSYQRLQRLADELGVSRSWLTSVRACAAAWPPKERRPSVSWHVHRRLAPFPDRVERLDRFVRHCEQRKITPSFRLLQDWLDSTAPLRPTLGRPRVDPAVRLERQALALDDEALTRLVERLEAVLRSRRLTLAS